MTRISRCLGVLVAVGLEVASAFCGAAAATAATGDGDSRKLEGRAEIEPAAGGNTRAPVAAGVRYFGFGDTETATAGHWETNVYGAPARIDLDPEVKREGQAALRVTAAELSDAALGQEITLHPNQWYRASAWIKTRALQARTARTLGALVVQKPGGRGIIASTPNRSGDSEWTASSLLFKAPPDGRVRVCLFFAGFGTGTGTAWFDGVTLEPAKVAGPLKVTREPLVRGRIDPRQYGQFIEYLCDLVPGMWAEKVSDGSFEGSTPYLLVFLKEKDVKGKPWYPSGAMNRARYSLDRESKVSGEVSQKIVVEPGAPCVAGLSQDGIYLERGAALNFSAFFRAEQLRGPVRLKLHREGHIVGASEFRPGRDWQKFEARLAPSQTVADGTLTIEFGGPATLWIDNVSLMPAATIGGWRRDAVGAVRALKPGVIRFGGSALEVPSFGDFEWRNTIGPVEARKPWRGWGGIQPLGAGLEEFVQFCRAVGAEPLMCVRFNQRSPKDAAEEVEYFNGSANTPMGALRARNGHPEPYRIRCWQVGNEVAGAEYDQKLRSFCEAMKGADPGITLLSSFPTPNSIRNAAPLLDYVAPHHYSADLTFMENEFGVIKKMIEDNASGRPLKVAVTEWNTTAGDPGPRRAMLWTLENALACARYRNLLHRHADLVEIANRSNLANSFCSGIIQTDSHRLYKTPTYYTDWLYANEAGTQPLKIEAPVPANVGLDVSATLSADGREAILFAANDSVDEIVRQVDFSAFGRGGRKALVWTLSDRDRAGEPDVTNSFGDPERVTARKTSFRARGEVFEYRFPPLSLTVLKWRMER